MTAILSGIRREYASGGDRPRTPRDPLLVDDIRALVSTAEAEPGWVDEMLERRGSAILLLRFADAYRRSDLSEMVCGDATVHRHDAHRIRLRKPETDQEGRGAVKALPYTASHETCPLCAYVRWADVVAAYDAGGRTSVIRLLRNREPFAGHVCRGGVARGTVAKGYHQKRKSRLNSTIWGSDPLDHPDAEQNTQATALRHSPSSGDTRSAPASSPKARETVPMDPSLPATPVSTPSKSTAASTHDMVGSAVTGIGL
ncbi:hypothetical protein [Rhodococcoides fascians]|uniref:hypothetical protein n=1 Tax=Rhodococcoides fascians TaxID=1828 RepID=UPI00269B24A8